MAATVHTRGVIVIGTFKLLKGLLLLVVGIGALRLMHKDVALFISNLADFFRIDPDNQWINRLLEKTAGLNSRRLQFISAGSFFYSGLLIIEGVGLLLRKHWAEYLVIVLTASLIPLEFYELAKHITALRMAVLLVNIAIVIYLVHVVRKQRRYRRLHLSR
ncbi:MAG TPA: DUF2127 domain-containing protein [Candidatus Dormibacteraeota bacterium]|nr:DUF2127 domain-containing protein [Candidatus Dormibacteraeota bacterium]